MLTNTSILGALEAYYVRKASEEERGCPVRGSQTGACPRKLSSLLAGVPPMEVSAKSSRVFEDGHLRGIALAHAMGTEFVQQGKSVAFEAPVFTEIPGIKDPAAVFAKLSKQFPDEAAINGIGVCLQKRGDREVLTIRSRIDLLAKDPNGSASIVEIKGKGSYGMKLLPKEGPGVEYVAQLGCQILGAIEGGLHVASAHFLFENKDTNEWEPIAVHTGDAMETATIGLTHISMILNAYAEDGFVGEEGSPLHALAAEAVDKKKLPWQCDYCSVGPINGKCMPGRKLIDTRKPNTSVPKWTWE